MRPILLFVATDELFEELSSPVVISHFVVYEGDLVLSGYLCSLIIREALNDRLVVGESGLVAIGIYSLLCPLKVLRGFEVFGNLGRCGLTCRERRKHSHYKQ